MDYRYMIPSLEEIAVTKLTILLLIPNFERNTYCFDSRLERRMNDATKENVRKLNIPEAFKKKILEYIKFIYVQIQEWFHYHETFLYGSGIFMSDLCSSKLCWMVYGTIDRKKTAELLVEDERLEVKSRYRLACVYCLENNIPELRNELYVEQLENLCDKNYGQMDLVSVWTYTFNDMERVLNNYINSGVSYYEYALRSAARYGNEVAIEYFLQKLDSKLRDRSLLYCARLLKGHKYEFLPKMLRDISSSYEFYSSHSLLPEEYYHRSMCCLFLQMSESQQMEALRRGSKEILWCLLHWPWLQFVIPTVKRMMGSLNEGHYLFLLERIARQATERVRVSEFQKLFRDLWQLIPTASKRYVRRVIRSNTDMLHYLISLEDTESIALIFSNSSFEERTSFIFSFESRLHCESLIRKRNWGMLRFFVEQFITTKDLMKKFNSEFLGVVGFLNIGLLENNLLKEFHELLDHMVEKCM